MTPTFLNSSNHLYLPRAAAAHLNANAPAWNTYIIPICNTLKVRIEGPIDCTELNSKNPRQWQWCYYIITNHRNEKVIVKKFVMCQVVQELRNVLKELRIRGFVFWKEPEAFNEGKKAAGKEKKAKWETEIGALTAAREMAGKKGDMSGKKEGKLKGAGVRTPVEPKKSVVNKEKIKGTPKAEKLVNAIGPANTPPVIETSPSSENISSFVGVLDELCDDNFKAFAATTHTVDQINDDVLTLEPVASHHTDAGIMAAIFDQPPKKPNYTAIWVNQLNSFPREKLIENALTPPSSRSTIVSNFNVVEGVLIDLGDVDNKKLVADLSEFDILLSEPKPLDEPLKVNHTPWEKANDLLNDAASEAAFGGVGGTGSAGRKSSARNYVPKDENVVLKESIDVTDKLKVVYEANIEEHPIEIYAPDGHDSKVSSEKEEIVKRLEQELIDMKVRMERIEMDLQNLKCQ